MKTSHALLVVLLLLVSFEASASPQDPEGLSRTSWGRFGWWETSIDAQNRTNIDGLLSYNVTLEGISGTIRARPGEQWAGVLAGNSRIWEIKLAGGGAGRSTIVLSRTWKFSTDPDNKGLERGWEKPGFDDSKWRTMTVGPLADAQETGGLAEAEKGAGWGAQVSSSGEGKTGAWENQGLPDYDGVAWYRLEATIPAEWKADKILYHCYGIDDEDTTFVNGVKVGETTMKENPTAYIAERTYEIPADVIQWGEKNSFAVRVFDDHGDGGFTGTAPEIVRGAAALEAQSVKPQKAGEAPKYIKKLNWVTKWIELPDYKMTYSLASALVRVTPKGEGITLRFDAPVKHAAYVKDDGVKVASSDGGAFYDPARDGQMKENWILLWHGDAVGHNEDMPVLLVLHGKPAKISVEGGDVTISAKRSSFDLGPPLGLRQFSGSDTQKWAVDGVPEDVVKGCRFWSRATLAYPVGQKELYNVDHDREMVTFTEQYEYEIVEDDWGTAPMKIAAIPQIVACLLDAGYPGKIITARTDLGFISYAGPFAATVDSDTAVFELPIPVEDSFAGLETPGQEGNLDEMTRGTVNLMHRWSGRDWKNMGSDSGRLEQSPPDKDEPMDFDQARERTLLGTYPVIGIPKDHVPGAPLDTPWTSSPLNSSIHLPPFLIADERVRPGIVASIRQMARGMDSAWSDQVFYGGIWRVEFEPTFKKPMTYLARYRYKNIPDRANGEAPYDFTAISGFMAYGFKEAGLWTGDWGFVRKRWHKLLQVCDPYWRNHDWATAACDNKDSRPNSSVDITWDNYAGLEALARCAYAIGDVKTYDFLCYLRARLALGTVAHEALQQYLQPVLHWPDRFFAGHIGEPYPPYRSGLVPESGVAMEWSPPYPDGAMNQVPLRFNNAGTSCPGVGLRWMAMTQPKQTRWVLQRLKQHVPHYMEGNLWEGYTDKPGPPFLSYVQKDVAANCLTLRYFVGEPADAVLADFNCLAHAPALSPFNVERMTIEHARGQLQNLLYTANSPMWASVWEPRVIWTGRYDPAKGEATIIVEPGETSLRFKGGARFKPQSVAINGSEIPERGTLREARASGGWYYGSDRSTIHVYSDERGRIEMVVRFKADPDAPAPRPRMAPEQPVETIETNLLTNGSFDEDWQNTARSPFVGPVTGPYLYVNRWMAPGEGPDQYGPHKDGLIRQVGTPWRTAGLSLRMYAGKDGQVIQNVAAKPGLYRLTAWVQLGRREWDASQVECKIFLKARQADADPIKELKDASFVLAPSQVKRNEWTPIVLEMDAPEGTNALQVGVSFLPLQDDGDAKRQNPVYVDDMELVRVEKLSGKTTQIAAPDSAAAGGLDTGLAAHWTLENVVSGETIPDVSGSKNHGKVSSAYKLVNGVAGKALAFDGKNTFVECPKIDGVDWAHGNFTVSLWVNITTTEEGGKSLLEYGGAGCRYPGVILQYRGLDGGMGRVESYLAGADGNYIVSRGHDVKVNDGNWRYIAFSVDRSGEAVTYIDGNAVHRQDISKNKGTALAAEGGAVLGKSRYGEPDLPMTVDDVRVYSRALSGDEILQMVDEAGDKPE